MSQSRSLPVLPTGHEFDHVPEEFRAKVAMDLLAHIDQETRRWDFAGFNQVNDYQRHLYALFLRLAGVSQATAFAEIYRLATDVPLRKRQRYAEEVIHSSIVGWPNEAGYLEPIFRPDGTTMFGTVPA